MNSFFNKILGTSRETKIAIQVCTDAALIVLCFLAAMTARLESFEFLARTSIWKPVFLSIPVTLLAFRVFGLYRSLVRFVTGDILIGIAKAVFVGAVFMYWSNAYFAAGIPRSVPFIFAFFLFLAVGGARFLVRLVFRRPELVAKDRVLIFGAGQAGRELLNALVHGEEYAPIAFIDDDPSLRGMIAGGRRVYGRDDIKKIVKENNVKAILLAIPSINRKQRREIVAELERVGVPIKTIPGLSEVISGRANIADVRDVAPEDLLGRDPIPPRRDLLGRNIAGKVVMVTGAGGSIGSELCRQILKLGPSTLILYEVSEFALYSIEADLAEAAKLLSSPPNLVPILGSVQDSRRLEMTVHTFGVQTIYHAAAYKHVPVVEENVVEGVRNNIFGTLAITKIAQRHNVENFILISTDKAVRPANIMGATKRVAELICQSMSEQSSSTVFSMVRFGNVLGSSGSVIPRFRAQIEEGGPLTVTHPEINRYFMTIPEASLLVIQAGAMAKGGDVFVLDMGMPVKILDLAKTMVRLHGLKPYIVDHESEISSEKGDIPIRITGLRKGEKLYEELLIGNNPAATEHPRIMTASEVSMPRDELFRTLDRLHAACEIFDLPEVHEILQELPIEFYPLSNRSDDLLWNESQGGGASVEQRIALTA